MAIHPPCPWFTHGRRYRLDNLPDDARAWLAPAWVAQPSAGERSVGHTAGSTWIVISMLATLVGSHAVFSIVVVRDDLLTMQVDGTKGSAIVGLRDVWTQHYGNTPRPVWNPDIPQPIDFFDGWQKVPEQENYDNAFKIQWELFLRHIALEEPFRWNLLEGAKGVQLAELGLRSSDERKWINLPELKA